MIQKRRIEIRDALALEPAAQRLEVWGWVRTARFGKAVSFVQLNDGSTVEALQLVFDPQRLTPDATLGTGACVRATGTLVASQGAGQRCELQVESLDVIGPTDPDYPLQKKKHTLEFLRDLPHLRSRTDTLLSVFTIRARICAAIHGFFARRGFAYVQPPLITVNDCEGGGEAFLVKTRADAPGDVLEDHFGRPAYLTVSAQLEAEALALALGKVYTFGPTFRADPSTTPRHAAEFWMVEPEAAFHDFEDLRELVESFVRDVVASVAAASGPELGFLERARGESLADRLAPLAQPFEVIEFADAIRRLQATNVSFENPLLPDRDLSPEHERHLTDVLTKRPTFIVNYPEQLKPFYMRLNDDGKTVACLDLLLPGLGEVASGSQREERHDFLKRRMTQKGVDEASFAWYLETRRWGSAPHSGFGLGLERLVMFMTGIDNIRDVIPFPRAGGKLF